jgi:hypothetical protein
MCCRPPGTRAGCQGRSSVGRSHLDTRASEASSAPGYPEGCRWPAPRGRKRPLLGRRYDGALPGALYGLTESTAHRNFIRSRLLAWRRETRVSSRRRPGRIDQAHATLIAGIITAIGSTVVGVSAVIFASLNTRSTLRNAQHIVHEERIADTRRTFAESLGTWLATEASNPEPALSVEKPGARKKTLNRPSDELIGRALIFEPGVAELLRKMKDACMLEDDVVLQQRPGEPAYFDEGIMSSRRTWYRARDEILELLRSQYRVSEIKRE